MERMAEAKIQMAPRNAWDCWAPTAWAEGLQHGQVGQVGEQKVVQVAVQG